MVLQWNVLGFRFLALMSGFLLAEQSQAFTFLTWDDAQYAKGPIKISYLSKSCQSIGISDDDMMFYIQQVISQYWGRVEESTLQLLSGELIQEPFFQSGEIKPEVMKFNTIHVACAEDFEAFNKNENGVVTGGIGKIYCEKDNECRGAVVLNGDSQQVSRVGRSYSRQFIGILAHEVGHALGLGHSLNLGALMTAGTPGFFSFYSIKNDDRRAIQALFPVSPRPTMRDLLVSKQSFAELASRALIESGFARSGEWDPTELKNRCERFTNAVLNQNSIYDYFGEKEFQENLKIIGMFFFRVCQEASSSREVQVWGQRELQGLILRNLQ